MPTLSRYCKAYLVHRLRAFDGWSEAADAAQPGGDGETPRVLTDDDFLYLHDTYVVTDGIYIDEHVIFDAVDDAWRTFCHEQLGFSVPDFEGPPGRDDG